MTESVEWLRLFIFHYPYLQYIVIFFGVIIGGGLTLFILGFLAAQNIISLFSFTLVSLLAVFSSDALWFLLSTTAPVKRMILHRYAHTTISVIAQAITRVSKGNHFKAFVFAKFLIGTPVILIIYLNKTGLKFKDFFYHNVFAIFIWLFINILIGLIAGLGFIYFAQIFKNIYAAIGFILVVIMAIAIVQIWIEKEFTQKGR